MDVRLRTLIIGNSGSGKTTLGRRIAHFQGAMFMSLDDLAFIEGAVRQALADSIRDGLAFLRAHLQRLRPAEKYGQGPARPKAGTSVLSPSARGYQLLVAIVLDSACLPFAQRLPLIALCMG